MNTQPPASFVKILKPLAESPNINIENLDINLTKSTDGAINIPTVFTIGPNGGI
jgi:hypothetical protein